MADHQQSLVPLSERLEQQGATGAVEVVAGFIQNQVIGLAQKRPKQGDTHGLATAQGRDTPVCVQLFQPMTCQVCL
ncbi:hypothetical protein D3C79_1087590 [compost metagenome]